MTNQRFDALCRRVMDGTATPMERARFVNNAIALRQTVVDAISDSDCWDRDWDVIGWDSTAIDRSGHYSAAFTPDDPIVWAKEKSRCASL
jgi:hypothetical protein